MLRSMKISISSILSTLIDIKENIQHKTKKIFKWYSYKDNIFIEIFHSNTEITVKSVLKSLKEARFVMPSKHVKILFWPKVTSFGGYYNIPLIFQYINVGMHWKDKFETPRFEGDSIFGPSPAYIITIFRLIRIVIYWTAPSDPNNKHSVWDHSDYWEMWLWYYFYQDKDIKKAKMTWPWTSDDKSTWSDYFVPNV